MFQKEDMSMITKKVNGQIVTTTIQPARATDASKINDLAAKVQYMTEWIKKRTQKPYNVPGVSTGVSKADSNDRDPTPVNTDVEDKFNEMYRNYGDKAPDHKANGGYDAKYVKTGQWYRIMSAKSSYMIMRDSDNTTFVKTGFSQPRQLTRLVMFGDGDGKISMEEFKSILNSKVEFSKLQEAYVVKAHRRFSDLPKSENGNEPIPVW